MLAPLQNAEQHSTPEKSGIKFCRTCYDHLAGKVAVEIAGKLIHQKIIIPRGDLYDVTKKGVKWFGAMNINMPGLKNSKRIFARQCLDWSERRHHLAGALGAALLEAMMKKRWFRKTNESRITIITNEGRTALYDRLGILV